jgi:hypothetical protein
MKTEIDETSSAQKKSPVARLGPTDFEFVFCRRLHRQTVGPKNRGGQWTELSNRVDSTGNEAVTLVEDGGSDRVGGSVGGMATEELLVLTIFVMLDDIG